MANSEAYQQQLTALQGSIGELLAIDENDYDTSGFDRSLIEKLRQLHSSLGQSSVGSPESQPMSKNLSGSVGKGGDNQEADVRLVQDLLNQKASAGLQVDGKFGPKTLSAIEAFQRSAFNGWSDGLIEPGQNTWKALSDGVAPTTDPSNGGSTGTGGGGTGPIDGNNDPVTNKSISGSVGAGGDNKKEDVTTVQELLNLRGGTLKVDGGIGRLTIGTIKNYQTSIGVETDGLITPNGKTWKALLEGKGNAGGPGNVAPGNKNGIKAVATRYGFAGDTYGNANDRAGIGNNNNRLVQGKSVALSPELYELLGIGYKSGAWINVEFPNGSVKKFQTADQTARNLTGLRVDFYDPEGKFKSVDGKPLYVTKVSSGGSQEPADPTPTNDDQQQPTSGGISASVGKGGVNKEADVRRVQELLNAKGGKLTVDGKYGGNTGAAIESFQRSIFNGWSDGLIDPGGKTWQALVGTGGQVTSSTAGGGPEVPPLQSGQKPSTSNFKYQEFISPRDPQRYIPEQYWGNLNKLMASLEVIRKELGVSLNINSGYRSPRHNKNVGGVSNSQHLYAKAADISSGLPPKQVFDTIVRLMDQGKIAKGGIGRYRTFTHYDIRGTKAPFYKI